MEGAASVVLSRPLGRMDAGRYERRPRGRRGSLTRWEDDSMVDEDETVWCAVCATTTDVSVTGRTGRHILQQAEET